VFRRVAAKKKKAEIIFKLGIFKLGIFKLRIFKLGMAILYSWKSVWR
jgi:hypothetical protein